MLPINIFAWVLIIFLFISFVFSLVALWRKPRFLRETENEISSRLNKNTLKRDK